jgi:hypothetical protein
MAFRPSRRLFPPLEARADKIIEVSAVGPLGWNHDRSVWLSSKLFERERP